MVHVAFYPPEISAALTAASLASKSLRNATVRSGPGSVLSLSYRPRVSHQPVSCCVSIGTLSLILITSSSTARIAEALALLPSVAV